MARVPSWFREITRAEVTDNTISCGPKYYIYRNGVWNASHLDVSDEQKQTEEIFTFKWNKELTFDSPNSLRRVREWLVERYGEFSAILAALPPRPIVLDAGCGAGMSALEYCRPFSKIRYIGCDISEAIWVGAKRLNQYQEGEKVFIREDIAQLPFIHESIDCIFSEGVLHHTDSTRGALASLAPLLRKGGYFLFYVYRKKGPIREFTDDYIRQKLQLMTPDEAWDALNPLTSLGIQLGNINAELDLPYGFPLLDIPPGKISLQQFFYWHIFKAFYHADLSFDEMNHINFDWFAPKNAFRQTAEEVCAWCDELGLSIRRKHIENSGITIVAQKL